MSKHNTGFKSVVLGVVVALGLVITAALPAQASSTDPEVNDQGQCLATPSRTDVINHAEVSHPEEVKTPGEDAIVRDEFRWSREVPAVEEISYEETQFFRIIPGQDEVTHEEYRFTRLNPGQDETFTQYFKYKKVIPATAGVEECQWKISVDDYTTKYQYQKQVKGVVQVKGPYGWQNTGGTFDWEWYTSPSYQWSFDDTSVLESGGHNSVQATWTEGGKQYRKVTTAYQYAQNGVTEQVKTGSHWDYQWSTEKPGEGWVKTGDCRWLVEPTPEQVVYYNDGDWTTDILGDPWVEIDSKSVGNDDAVAPFVEYKTADGVTTNEDEAAWFQEESFEGWEQFGESNTVIDQEWVLPISVFLTVDDEGNFGETEDVNDASWIRTDDERVDRSVWSQVIINEFHDPKVRTIVVQEGVAGYTEYYVPGGDPTRELGDSNWTTDEPEGWTFVDEREFVVKEAVPPTVTTITVVDKAAWTERKFVPATYGDCTLAMTGGSLGLGALLSALGLLGVGGAALWFGRRRSVTEDSA